MMRLDPPPRWCALSPYAPLNRAAGCRTIIQMAIRRRSRAAMALAALLLPWANAVAVSVHLAHGHGGTHDGIRDHGPTDDHLPVDVVHGHHHAEGTPDHDHFLAPLPAGSAIHPRGVIVKAMGGATCLSGLGTRQAAVALRPPLESPSPPIPLSRRSSVLRI
jgi:hypothetical protein